jgi:DNA-binding transcriptional regulator WhiA
MIRGLFLVDGSIRDPVQDPLDLEARSGPVDLISDTSSVYSDRQVRNLYRKHIRKKYSQRRGIGANIGNLLGIHKTQAA